jgi:transcriptional regulator with XRE-family HTH domain
MISSQLEGLGQRIAELRYKAQLKQSELARDAGVSLRTLQRFESGEIVKTDVLLKILQRLGRLDEFFGALAPAELSPYEQLEQAGLTPADLGKHKAVVALSGAKSAPDQTNGLSEQRRRVRRRASKKSGEKGSAQSGAQVLKFQWPEDKVS